MKIISNYVDGYDYFSYVYGVDDNITLVREGSKPGNNFKSKNIASLSCFKSQQESEAIVVKFLDLSEKIYIDLKKQDENLRALFNRDITYLFNTSYRHDALTFLRELTRADVDIIEYGVLVVIDKAYHLVCYRDREKDTVDIRVLTNELILHLADMGGINNPPKLREVIQSRHLESISNIVKYPIYIITKQSKEDVKLHFNTPPLNTLGIDHLIDWDQTYKDIYNFMVNLKTDPEPQAVDDATKIGMKGFDNQISFRHRK